MTVTSNKWCARTFFIVSAFLFAGAGVQAQPISAYLYGQNHWLADGDEGRVGYIHNLWPQVKASGVLAVTAMSAIFPAAINSIKWSII
jgi:hypothetical protein